jgi:hypothetical protein
VSRNWTTGIDVRGTSRVLIDRCRVENNINWGIRVRDTAKVKINETQAAATGFRVSGGLDFPRVNDPTPDVGIEFENQSSGLICNSCVTASFRGGIRNSTGQKSSVELQNVCAFDNAPN